MNEGRRWTIADLEAMPDPGFDPELVFKRYEIIDGGLHVSEEGHVLHQSTCANVAFGLQRWIDGPGFGFTVMQAGVLFSLEDFGVPDVIWLPQSEREVFRAIPGDYPTWAPDLLVEVLMPGVEDKGRDREVKRRLYSAQGVREYWVIDWQGWVVRVLRIAYCVGGASTPCAP